MKRIGANSLTRRLKTLAFFLFFLISPFCLLSHAAVITVPGDYSTIQGAIDVTSDGDEIIVSPGTYYENINFNGKNIILRSNDPTSPTIVASTVIDGRSTDSVVKFLGTESPNCVLSGFTITNGRVYYEGGGIYGNGTRATIQNSNITANSAYYWYKHGIGSGGGLHDCDGTIKNNSISGNSAGSQGGGLYDCDGRIENNNISGNRAGGGGGLHGCDGTICNNTISGNNSGRDGGGLSNCNGTIRNNIISGNVAAYGMGGGLNYCSGNIQNNAICSNEAYAFGGGLYWCDGTIQSNTIAGNRGGRGAGLDSCTGFIINCIIWGNSGFEASQLFDCSTPLYSCIQDWIGGGRGNISADPRFVDPDNGNFHLQPDSPCIDAGNTYYLCGDYLVDIDGECRVEGSSLDMGSDEYASSSDSDGDLLSDEDEFNQGSDPDNTDTDLDGLKDGVEVLRGTDPTVYNGPSGIFIPAHYATIQQGIFMAFPLEVITVSPGTYYENLRFLGKNFTLQSTNPLDDDIVNSTIIDGAALFSVIFFEGTEDETCVVEGLTIRNGAGFRGAGIDGNGALLAIRNNQILDNQGVGVRRCNGIIEKNTVSGNLCGLGGCSGIIQNNIVYGNVGYGGGLAGCDGIIQNNIISRNTADGGRYDGYGGGLYGCDGTIRNNIISGNSAIGQEFSAGGGLAKCGGTIRNNTISGNWAKNHGGGLYDCNDTIQNNTIIENSAGDGGGGLDRCKGFIINCIIWGNSAPDGSQVYDSSTPFYSCIQDWTGDGTGNISLDPQLVDPANGDFHLGADSPCIDAGGYVEGLAEDFEGDPRPMDGTSEPRGDGSDFDIGADEFPGPVPLGEYNFDLTDEGWTSVTLSAYFTPPDCYYMPGHIILTSRDNTNTYGFWTSEADAVPVIADCLYRASWTVATDVTDPLAVPHMQLRVNSQNFQQADMLVVSSCGDGSYAPTPDGRTYEMYFIPPESALGKPEDQDDLILSFDILNFDPSDAAYGSVMLDRVVVDAIPLETLDTPTLLKTWRFDTDAEGWQFVSAPILFTPPTSNIASGALWLTAQNNTNTFGFWSGPSEEVQVEEGKLYRLRFTVSTDVTIQEEVPQLRLRTSSEDFQSGIVKVISSVTGAEMSPTPAGRTYDLYFYPPQSLVGTEADSILTAFDMLNFDPADTSNGSLILDSVLVESLNIP